MSADVFLAAAGPDSENTHSLPATAAATSGASQPAVAETGPSTPRPRQTRWFGRQRPTEPVRQAPTTVDLVPEDLRAACRAALRRPGSVQPRSVAVTSTVRQEGRTTVALTCALVEQEEHGRSTVLLELDLDRPGLGQVLGLSPRPGVAELLRGQVTLDETLTWITPQLGVVLGGVAPDPARLLLAFRHSGLLAELEQAGYGVVADLPPVSPGHHGDRVVDLFDEVVLVVTAGATPLELVRGATLMLPRPPALLLNGTSSSVPRWIRRPLGL